MNKKEIQRFFDKQAASWDRETIRDDEVVKEILDLADADEGARFLDVACGTGVLFQDYLNRRLEDITAIDISPKMTKIAREKFPQIPVLCGDAETFRLVGDYDVILIYNAFPHFPSPRGILEAMARVSHVGTRLTVAHGMSREAINECHKGAAAKISVELPAATELSKLFEACGFDVDVMIEDDRKYVVSGTFKGDEMRKTLMKYCRSNAGNMRGNHNSRTVVREDDTHAIISTSDAEWYAQDPVVAEYRVDVAVMDEIEDIFYRYGMKMWQHRKFSNMFVCDGASTSHSFSFEDFSDYVSFSSQIYSDYYWKKLKRISDAIDRAMAGAEKLPGLVLPESSEGDNYEKHQPQDGKTRVEVYKYCCNVLEYRMMNGTGLKMNFPWEYKLTNKETGEVLAEEEPSKYSHEVYPHRSEEYSITLEKRLEPGKYELQCGKYKTEFEIR